MRQRQAAQSLFESVAPTYRFEKRTLAGEVGRWDPPVPRISKVYKQ